MKIILIGLISIIAPVYLILLIRITRNKHAVNIGGDIIIGILLFMLMGVKIFPFNYLEPTTLSGYNKTIESAAIQLLIYLITLLIFRRKFNNLINSFIYLLKAAPVVSILLAFSILSTCWSETPWVTFRASLILISISILASNIATHSDWKHFSNILRWSTTAVTLLSFITCLLFSSARSGKGWSGILQHPIPLGAIAAFNAILWYLFAITQLKHRLVAFSVSIVSIVVMLFTHSAGAYVIFASMFTFILLIQFLSRFTFKSAIIIINAFLAISIVMSIWVNQNSDTIFGFFGKDPTLTGRTEFWTQLIDDIRQKPLSGYAIRGFWQEWRGLDNPAANIVNPNGYRPPNAHNGYLELGLELGISGLFIFGISFLNNLAQAVRLLLSRGIDYSYPILLLIYLVLYNSSSSGLFETNYIWFCYVFMCVRFSVEKSAIASSTRIKPLLISRANQP